MNKRNLILIFPLIVLAAAITLVPDFTAGKLPDGRIIEIRDEDILLAVMLVFSLCFSLFSSKNKIAKPPLFFVVLIWLAAGFFTLLINIILSNIGLAKGALYFLKEVEFFLLYLYIFFHLKNMESARLMVKLWGIFMLANAGFVLYQFLFRVRYGEYGTAALSEYGVFPTGAFFLISFIFLFNFFLYSVLISDLPLYKKIFWCLVALSPAIGILGSYSKTNLAGFFFSIIAALLLLVVKTRNIKAILIFLLLMVLMAAFLFFFLSNVKKSQRMNVMLSFGGAVESYKAARWDTAIIQEWEKIWARPVYAIFLGLGKGYGETHNQYVRNLAETGILGSLAFLVMALALVKRAGKDFFKSKDGLLAGLSAGFLISALTMLLMGLATEPFLTVKPAETFWFFAAITMAVSVISQKQNEKSAVQG